MIQWPVPGSDPHFDIVCLPEPPAFASETANITFRNALSSCTGPGTVFATISEVGGTMAVGVADWTTAFSERSTPGRIKPEDEYSTVTPSDTATAQWIGEGGHKTKHSVGSDIAGAAISFTLGQLTLTYGEGQVAYTRELFRGPNLQWLMQPSPFNETGFRRDRVEGRALGRRTSIRDLKTADHPDENLISVVYDGIPHTDTASDALWLTCSLLAGQALAPAISETFDASGKLLTRTYRPGNFTAARADAPFHIYYAPFQPAWLELLVDKMHAKLQEGFPIDVVIAHAQDATEGAIDRCMQSYLLAIHTASEAWSKSHEQTTFYDKEKWADAVLEMTKAVSNSVDFLSEDMIEIIERKLGDANNTGTNSRLRSFCTAVGVDYSGADKKAVDLRNVLFHNGYLQRRFANLSYEKRQERYDFLMRQRDFVYRIVFSLLDFPFQFRSALEPYRAISARNVPAISPEQ